MTRNDRHLSADELKARITSGTIDTVVVAFTDMQGRLQGKRLHGHYFVDVVLGHGTEGCNYLLGVDIDMNTVGGYAITSWDRGYGDMEFVLDLDTIRLLTHLPATAMVQCDLIWPPEEGAEHRPVVQSPRSILKAQQHRAAELGYDAVAGTELEFIVFEDTYEEAHTANYTGLTPANQYNVDYSIIGTTRIEPLLRDIRNTMYAAGLNVEGAKGECNFGQHEIGFLYDDVLVTADNHGVYKTVAKEIAAHHGKSLTFMAKFNERVGSSCHIHLSLRGQDGKIVLGRRDGCEDAALRQLRGRRARDDAGLHAALRAQHQLLQAIRRRQLRADRGRLGHGQPHLRHAGRRPRPRYEGGMPSTRWGCQPVSGGVGVDRRRSVRHRAGARTGRRDGGQRLYQRSGLPADHADRGRRPVQQVDGGARGVRRRGRRSLSEQREHRAQGIQFRCHRLGKGTRF